jgi:hypothetical protein
MPDRRQRERFKVKMANVREIAEKQQRGFSPASVVLPKGVRSFSFREEKVYKLNPIAYVAGDHNPNAKAGFTTHELTYYTHSGIGLEPRDHHCCLRMNWGEPCPVCEEAQRLRDQGADWDTIKSLAHRKRQLCQWVDQRDQDKGIQVFEGSYYRGFGELLDEKLLQAAEEDPESPILSFCDPNGGMFLHVRAKKQSFKTEGGAASYISPTNIEMVPRDGISQDLFDKAIDLESVLKKLSYEELDEILHQTGGKKKAKAKARDDDEDEDEDEDEDGEEVSRNGRHTDDDDEENEEPEEKELTAGMTVEHEDYGECTVVKVSPDGSSLTLKDEDGKTHKAVDPADVTILEASEPDDEDEEPVVKKGKGAKAKARDDDDDDDEDDEDDEEDDDEPPDEEEDEEPVVKKKPTGRRGPR